MNISDITQKHTVIIGSTDSGKSTFAEYLFLNTPYKAIYYDIQEERNPKSDKVVLLEGNFTLDALRKYNRMVIYGKFNTNAQLTEITNIINILFRLGKYYPRRKVWCNLFVDESHEVAPKWDDDNPLNRVATKGLGYGIALICMTQRPAQLHNTILTQAKHHFFFNINFYETPYFSKFSIPLAEIEEWIKKEYHFAFWNGTRFEKFKPLRLKGVENDKQQRGKTAIGKPEIG